MEKINEFTTELKALLKKYNATIGCEIDVDTHGLICTMFVDFDNTKSQKLGNGWYIDQSELKDILEQKL
jgi:hypothetical protein